MRFGWVVSQLERMIGKKLCLQLGVLTFGFLQLF